MTAPAKPIATWTVFEFVQHAEVTAPAGNLANVIASDVAVLIEIAGDITARTGAEACWHVAETQLKERATGEHPPVLTASRNGTSHGLTEARPYALKPTVERVR